ncbi:Arm DNA-binding domain-containing protein [Sneathiella limimaris]|uniref:Arm DNA-binding domain-containing protein n=1 Tax=Sneathiella limimaris TaxID=1964213 RepID=UPI001469AAE5|nr:DUF3596 domain-containing protein [Sneathiella limimaris]
MGTVNNRNDLLYLDFRYKNTRCREYTKLSNTAPNRKRLRMLMDRIEAEITLGTFEYSKYFPNSNFAKRFYTSAQTENNPQTNLGELFSDFAETWFSEKEAEWRNSHRSNQRLTLDKYLLPVFGDKPLIAITKPDILKFRSDLVKQNGLDVAYSIVISDIGGFRTFWHLIALSMVTGLLYLNQCPRNMRVELQ